MVVGEHEVPFIAHEALICASSEFFKTCLSGRRRPAIVRLKDVDQSLFQLYMQWLYNQDSCGDAHRPSASQTSTKFADLTPGELARCYVLGDRLLSDGFKNHVVDVLVDRFNAVQEIQAHAVR